MHGTSEHNNQKNNIGKKIVSPSKDDASTICLSSSPLNLMERGFFPIWRKIIDWGWYKDPTTSRVFFHLLLTVNYKKKDYMGHTVLPGQVVTGRKSLSSRLGLGEQQIRTALNRLKSTNEITIENHNKFSIVTLLNYSKHLKSTSEPSPHQPAPNHHLTTTNKDKKDNKDKKKSRFTPPTLEDIKSFAKEKGIKLDSNKFFYHYNSNGWKVGKNKMVSWESAVHKWGEKIQPIKQPKIEPRPLDRPPTNEEADAIRKAIEGK